MAPLNLTPTEIADLIQPTNHPSRLSLEELDHLTGQLSDPELEAVIDRLGLGLFSRQLPLLIDRILLAAQRVAADSPPEYDDGIDDLIRNFDVSLTGMVHILLVCRMSEYLPQSKRMMIAL